MHAAADAPESALTFPCLFPLKVMGLNTDALYPAIHPILAKHVPDLDEAAFTSRLGSSEKYLSITVTITARSRARPDAIYQELNDHELVLMTLRKSSYLVAVGYISGREAGVQRDVMKANNPTTLFQSIRSLDENTVITNATYDDRSNSNGFIDRSDIFKERSVAYQARLVERYCRKITDEIESP